MLRDFGMLGSRVKGQSKLLEFVFTLTPSCSDMLGSWSIKAVLPTIAPEMDYKLLEGINVGTEASSAYLEAINPETSEERREEIRVDMLRYCKHDTAAMLKLVQFFAT